LHLFVRHKTALVKKVRYPIILDVFEFCFGRKKRDGLVRDAFDILLFLTFLAHHAHQCTLFYLRNFYSCLGAYNVRLGLRSGDPLNLPRLCNASNCV